MIAVESFCEPSDAFRDLTPALRRASAAARDGATLALPEGEWHLRPEEASCSLRGITNHDFGPRLLALDLSMRNGITIEGNGCTLLSAGTICPLWFAECQDLTIRNLRLDRLEPLNLSARIMDVEHSLIRVQIEPAFNPRWSAWAGDCEVHGSLWKSRVEILMEWDPLERAPVPGSGDNLGGWGQHWTFEADGDCGLIVRGGSRHRPLPGNHLLLRTLRRPAPAIALDRCDSVRIENVCIHAAGGMGIVAQRCRDISVLSCSTTPSPRGPGFCAELDDATHFANCAGTIILKDCLFERQLDDGTNIHGAYFPILRRTGPHSLLVERRHPQQAGAPVGGPGDEFAICGKDDLADFWAGRACEVNECNSHCAELVFADPLPDKISPGDALDNLTWHPEARITDCTFRHNRARGVLLSSRKPMVVEKSLFQVPGSAISVAGSLGYWCESGPVSSLRIESNHFAHCATEPMWGDAVIQCGPEAAVSKQRVANYHSGIQILGNTFDLTPDSKALAAESSEIRWQQNQGTDFSLPVGSMSLPL